MKIQRQKSHPLLVLPHQSCSTNDPDMEELPTDYTGVDFHWVPKGGYADYGAVTGT